MPPSWLACCLHSGLFLFIAKFNPQCNQPLFHPGSATNPAISAQGEGWGGRVAAQNCPHCRHHCAQPATRSNGLRCGQMHRYIAVHEIPCKMQPKSWLGFMCVMRPCSLLGKAKCHFGTCVIFPDITDAFLTLTEALKRMTILRCY